MLNHRLIEFGHEAQARRRDLSHDLTPVRLAPLAMHESPLFKPVEQASDVGVLVHQPRADFA